MKMSFNIRTFANHNSISYMRKFFLHLLFAHISLAASAVTLKGQIIAQKGNIPAKAYIGSFLNQTLVDTIPVTIYGGFTYELKETVPTLYRLQAGRGSFLFFVSPKSKELRVKLTTESGDVTDAATEDYREDEAYNALTKLFETFDVAIGKAIEEKAGDTLYQIILGDFYREMQGFSVYYKGTLAADSIIQMRKFSPQIFSEANALSNYRNAFFNEVNFTDTALTATPVYANMIDFFSKELCSAANDNERKKLIAGLMKNAARVKRNYVFTADKIFASSVVEKAENTAITFMEWFRENADTAQFPVLNEKTKRLSASMPGKPFKDIDFGSSYAGVSLAEAIAKNKFTLLIFWESSCSHCRQTLPVVKQLHTAFGKKGFDVFAIATDEKPESWKEFLGELKPTWTNNAGITEQNHPALQHYFITQLPTLILINQNGAIEKRLTTLPEIGSFLQSRL